MASDFTLADCLTSKPPQLCWDCANACGGCSWTEVDPDTGKVRFEPVPGWDASPVIQKFHGGGTPRDYFTGTYVIRACPEFVKEERHGTASD